MKRWSKRIVGWLFGFTGTAIYCPKCKSMNVTFGDTVINCNAETYDVKCKDCGATGTITEKWN
jgi:ribosomal protein S27E